MRLAGLFFVASSLLACSADGTPIADDGGAASDARDGSVSRPHALLGGRLADSPWPSDLFLVDGHIRVDRLPFGGQPAAQAQIIAALARLDGAPVKTSVFFRLADAAALQSGWQSARATLYELTASGAAPRELSLFYRAATEQLVAVAPFDLALRPGARYACVVGDELVAPSPEMRAALRGDGPHAAVYQPLRARAAALGVDLERVGAATVFTVGSPDRRLAALVAQLEQLASPRARVTRIIGPEQLDAFFGTPNTHRAGLGDPSGIVHDAVGWVVLGDFETPRFLSGASHQLGTISVDSSGRAAQHGEMTVPFMLVLPRRVAERALPLMIFQHGLNSSRAQVAAVANDFARAGYATIGIDALWHGDRAVNPRDIEHNLSGAAGADGLADLDEAAAMLRLFAITGEPASGIAPFDGRAIQDNFRQAVVDVAQLVRLVARGSFSAIASAEPRLAALRLDTRRVVYSGESFGSILGVLSLATIPRLRAGVLAVPTAGLFTPTFQCSPFFAALLQPLLSSLFDRRLTLDRPDELPGAAQLSLALLQAALEPGDPVAYAARLRAAGDKSVLLLQAFSDEILPNQAGELLAQQLGAHVVAAARRTQPLRYTTLPSASSPLSGNAAGGRATIGIVNVAPATHGMISGFVGEQQFEPGFPPAKKRATPRAVDNPTEWLRRVTVRFADSYRRSGVAVVDTR